VSSAKSILGTGNIAIVQEVYLSGYHASHVIGKTKYSRRKLATLGTNAYLATKSPIVQTIAGATANATIVNVSGITAHAQRVQNRLVHATIAT
jgi:hypothetical protein